MPIPRLGRAWPGFDQSAVQAFFKSQGKAPLDEDTSGYVQARRRLPRGTVDVVRQYTSAIQGVRNRNMRRGGGRSEAEPRVNDNE